VRAGTADLPAARPGQVNRLKHWWLDRSVRVKGLIVVTIPLVALLAITLASLVLQASERQERQAATAAKNLSGSATQVLADAVNAETGLRGYVATDDPLFLQPYEGTLSRLARDVAALRAAALAEGDSRPERAVEETTARELAELAQMRSAAARGTSATALRPALESGKTTMDLLRQQVASLVAGPAAVGVARHDEIGQMESEIDTLTIAGLALGLVAGLIGVALFTSGISGRVVTAAANADRLGEGQPLAPVPAAADELGRLAASLVRAEALLATRSAELIASRDEALKATMAKNVFLSSTSHELRTPLNSVLGFTQLLQMADLAEEDRDSVERILAAGRHLLALINELIDISRIESGEFSLSVEPVWVEPVVEEACKLMAPLAAKRFITISQHCSHPDLAVRADRQRLSQILVNLASNAIKYNRPGGAVAITCQPEGPGLATVAVADTGPGIAAADLERIFMPFERLGAERTGIEGTGIGLPLARAFAEAMSGLLTVVSVPGEGSTFTLTLPRSADIVRDPESVLMDPGVPQAAQSAETGARVLYVEDNAANIEVVTRFLRSRPALRLRSVESGKLGLELAQRDRPDLLLLDLHLPDLSGRDILAQLRADRATASLPVIVLSAEASQEVITEIRAMGIIAYLTKPLDLVELGQLIDSFMERYEQQADAAPPTAAP
jgi:signal transduction histidine kinase/ActR/RegA family two-component response regulator